MHSADLSPQLQPWSGALLVVRIIIIIRLDLDLLFIDLCTYKGFKAYLADLLYKMLCQIGHTWPNA